jgi:hypothetical protein
MASPVMAKPATALHGEPASGIVGSGGLNTQSITESLADRQARRLMERFALSIPVALVLAILAYGAQR